MLVIPLWAGLGIFDQSSSPAAAGHLASHGHGGSHTGAGEASAEAAAFFEKHRRPDGCVDPSYHGTAPSAHAGHAAPAPTGGHAHGTPDPQDATPVYVQAYSYGYLPERLCLTAGEPYLFRLLAIDVTHGWTIQLGSSSTVMRLPAGMVVERRLTFTRPGTYLVYCSYYCGLGHPLMQARIVVEPAGAT